MTQETTRPEETAAKSMTLHLAFELSFNKWKLAFSTGLGQKPRQRDLPARDLKRLGDEIRAAKKRFGLAAEAKVVSCYEAGRDGVWLHRHLVQSGIDNLSSGFSQH